MPCGTIFKGVMGKDEGNIFTSFHNLSELVDHVRVHIREEAGRDGPQMGYGCEFCGFASASQGAVKEHAVNCEHKVRLQDILIG